MEPKKNPHLDVHEKRNMLFSIGLLCSLAIVTTAFKWQTALDDKPIKEALLEIEEWNEIIPTERFYEQPKPKDLIIPVATTAPAISTIQAQDIALELDDDVEVETFDMTDFIVPPPEEPKIIVCTFLPLEQQASPKGGMEAFRTLLARNLHYPPRAIQHNVEGKVFVQFTVDVDGSLDDFKIVQGIGSGCDEEAIRVIKLSKWNPGKQRSKPVKSKMIQGITFQLQ